MSKYKKIIVDCDKPLLSAAVAVEQTFCKVKNKHNGEERVFRNQTEFWGHHAKKQGGQLSEWKNFLGCDHIDADDFTIEEGSILSEDIEDHLGEAKLRFGWFIGKIKKLINEGLADDYELAIHGEGNFRYDVANIVPYKHGRKDKPILFYELKEEIISQYKNKVKLVNEIEVDDYVSIKGWENYRYHLKTGKWEYLLAYQDKDLTMTPSPMINYDKVEEGVKVISPKEAALAYATQLLSGDKAVDNIIGLPQLGEVTRKQYNLRKGGVGKATALAILEGADIKQMFQRVVEAYKDYYLEPTTFKSWRGEELIYTWLDYLNENARLLYMLRAVEEKDTYNITQTLDRLGVEY